MDCYHAIGLMSGSSLDGLDIAYCKFEVADSKWTFRILKTAVVEYPEEWIRDIKALPASDAKTIWEAHARLGNYFGERVNEFIRKNSLQGKVDLIASHGHTVFHFPAKKFTVQIGDGAAVAVRVGIPVVCDFRTSDIAYGGQGTPIVPIGDKLLFSDYRFCLNIGGIANISCKTDDSIVAFDICAANQVLNVLSNKLGKEYDANGDISRGGNIDNGLLQRLNALEYYSSGYPKSLDNSFSREVVWPVLETTSLSTEDKLRTYAEHIAIQVANHIAAIAEKEKTKVKLGDKMLVTGGGAFNKFLIERIEAQTKIAVEVPDDETVKFKEALVIALMGVLRMRNEVNVLKSVTGASQDNVGGSVYLP
jgi:anhydro-N-acetylmuramic acid kinase